MNADFMKNLRDQVMNENSDEERIANITSLITCGFEGGGDNQRTLERFWDHILVNVNDFLAPLSEEERNNLPNGVMRRLGDAKAAAEAYAEEAKRACGVRS